MQVETQFSSFEDQRQKILQKVVLSAMLYAVSINNVFFVLPANAECTLYINNFSIFFVEMNKQTVEPRLQLKIGRVKLLAVLTSY